MFVCTMWCRSFQTSEKSENGPSFRTKCGYLAWQLATIQNNRVAIMLQLMNNMDQT